MLSDQASKGIALDEEQVDLISKLQLGHENLRTSHFSRHSAWKVCLHPGTCFTLSPFSKSDRQIVHEPNLNYCYFCLLAADEHELVEQKLLFAFWFSSLLSKLDFRLVVSRV